MNLCMYLLVSGDAGRMGKIAASPPALQSAAIRGGFTADMNAMRTSSGPADLSHPFFVAKKVVR